MERNSAEVRAELALSTEAKALHTPALISRSDVVATGIGERRVGGEPTGEVSVKVYVPRKLPLAELRPDRVLPRTLPALSGQPAIVDVEEMDEPFSPPVAAVAAGTGRRVDPAPFGRAFGRPPFGPPRAGASGANWLTSIGSLGAFVRPEGATDERLSYFVSCNHVLANFNTALLGSAIVQPSPGDGGLFPQSWVGSLAGYVRLRLDRTRPNYVDAAFARVLAPEGGSNEIREVGQIRGVASQEDLAIGQVVRKVGRTSGLTIGRITAVKATLKVSYWGLGPPVRRTLFHDQIITTLMGFWGDSGSILVDDRNQGVGLLFAGSATHTYFNSMEWVLRLLRMRL